MPTQFPTSIKLRTPAERTLTAPTQVIEFLDGTEQRWRAGSPLNAFALTFRAVNAADLAPVLAFLATVKGSFDAAWSFVGADGATYPAMGLEQDDITAVYPAPGRATFAVKLRQVSPSGSLYPTAAAVYPALPNGVITQRPFTQGSAWLTTRNDLPSGARYAWSELNAARGRWICAYPAITFTEIQGLLTFFLAMGGRYSHFSFHDPVAGTDHPYCRFDTDAFACQCMGGARWAVTLPVAEFLA